MTRLRGITGFVTVYGQQQDPRTRIADLVAGVVDRETAEPFFVR